MNKLITKRIRNRDDVYMKGKLDKHLLKYKLQKSINTKQQALFLEV